MSFIATWHQNRLVAPLMYEGYCTLRGFDCHKGRRLETLIQQAEYYLVYLPPSSPDLNLIEHQWFVLNHRMRQPIQSSQWFRQVVD